MTAGSMPARSTTARTTSAARSSGRIEASAPPYRPIGVRTASTIHASRTGRSGSRVIAADRSGSATRGRLAGFGRASDRGEEAIRMRRSQPERRHDIVVCRYPLVDRDVCLVGDGRFDPFAGSDPGAAPVMGLRRTLDRRDRGDPRRTDRTPRRSCVRAGPPRRDAPGSARAEAGRAVRAPPRRLVPRRGSRRDPRDPSARTDPSGTRTHASRHRSSRRSPRPPPADGAPRSCTGD